jgi:uncharacterized repeat protein (TIGR02543 family)
MLVWLDPPNLGGGGVLINDLNLKITAPDGTCYRGNQFSGEYSTAGCATFDAVNPDEGVRVQNPAVGMWVLQVQAANIGQSPQPFAVVCSGAIGDLQPLPSFATWTGQVIQDSCPSGGPGNGNGVIDPGEVVVLPVTLTNTGSVNLTNVSGVLSTSTAGVTITDNAATWPDLAVGASAQSNPDHFRFRVDPTVACGTPIDLNLAVTYAEGSNLTGSALRVGRMETTYLLREDFSGGIPPTWTVVDGGPCSGLPVRTWNTENPCHRSIGWPFKEPFAIVDSNCAGLGCGMMDEQLITPSLNASGCARVVLEFSNQFRQWILGRDEVADVDVSGDGGANWTNVLRMTSSDGYPTPNTKVVDITDLAAGKPNVKIRFRYYNANFEWWWAIDNVRVACLTPPVCDVCEAGFRLDVSVSGSGMVTSDPPGISCPGDCSEVYPRGTPVTLTATPAAGWVFAGWGGACAGQGNPCTLTMTADRSVTATFTTSGGGWAKTYGGPNWDGASSIQQTADGGYIVAGWTESFGAGNGDFWVLKLDQNGDIQWQKIYGGPSADVAFSIQQTADGGYIVAGVTTSFGAGFYDLWVLKLGPNGDVQWQKTYGGPNWDRAYSIQQTSDAGYIVAGRTTSFGAGTYDIWVLKLDANGDIVGCNLIGTSNATVSDTAVIGVATSASPGNTSVSGQNSNAVITNTNVTPSRQCPP